MNFDFHEIYLAFIVTLILNVFVLWNTDSLSKQASSPHGFASSVLGILISENKYILFFLVLDP